MDLASYLNISLKPIVESAEGKDKYIDEKDCQYSSGNHIKNTTRTQTSTFRPVAFIKNKDN